MKQIKIIKENGQIQYVLVNTGEIVAAEVIDLDLADSETHASRLPAYANWLQGNESLYEAEIHSAILEEPDLPMFHFEANLTGLRVIRYYSVMNPWLDFLVAVAPNDFDRAKQAIASGIEHFWDDNDICFGDAVTMELQEDGIFFYICYADLTEDRMNTTDEWDNWAEKIIEHHDGFAMIAAD